MKQMDSKVAGLVSAVLAEQLRVSYTLRINEINAKTGALIIQL